MKNASEGEKLYAYMGFLLTLFKSIMLITVHEIERSMKFN